MSKEFGLKLFGAGAAAAITISALTSEANAQAGAFSIVSSNPNNEITCKLDDSNCRYEASLVAKNQTGEPLYKTTWYTGIHSPGVAKILGQELLGFDGQWTWGQSEYSGIVNPDEVVTTSIKFSPPMREGRWVANFFIDGATCNFQVTPANCIYYGGSHYSVIVNRVQ